MQDMDQVKILITKTDKPNYIVDGLIEKLSRTGKKYNVQCMIKHYTKNIS